MEMHTVRIDRFLVDNGILTEEQFQKIRESKKEGESIIQAVISSGVISEERLVELMSKQLNIPRIDLDEIYLPENLIKRLPRQIIEKYDLIPVAYTKGVLTIATYNPFDFNAISEIQLVVDSRIELNLATPSSIKRAIQEIFYGIPKKEETKKLEGSPLELLDEIEKEKESALEKDYLRLESASLRSLVKALVTLFIEKGIITQEEFVRALEREEEKTI